MSVSMDRSSVFNTQISQTGNSQTKKRKYSQRAKHSIAQFFGVSEEDEKNAARWEKRRVRIASSIGRGLKGDAVPRDMTDGMPNITDPLGRTSRQISRVSSLTAYSDRAGFGRRDNRKVSVLKMSVKAITAFSGVRKDLRSKRSFKGQSFPPGSVGLTPDATRSVDDAFSLVDDVFYDEHPSSAEARSQPELTGGPSAPGWRRRPPQPLPSTPGEPLDVPDFGFSKIKEKVVQTAMKRDKRQVGVGILGRLMKRRLKSNVMTKEVKVQLDNMDDHRPYFTYWVTFVQIVVFIVSLAVYGIAPIGISTTVEAANVRMPNLAIQTENHVERDNLWIGPRQADLIHLGAKYSPCMREDINLNTAIGYDKKEESESACCIRNDGSGCVQSVKAGCSEVLSGWLKWTRDSPGPGGRTSGSVCGQDPRYCSNPSSTPPFEWPQDITDWPNIAVNISIFQLIVDFLARLRSVICHCCLSDRLTYPVCLDTAKPNQSMASQKDKHMSCDILGRPCCFGIQGECIITTREHCDLKRGFFHDEASLCSQVNCFEEICGMIPFANPKSPDQFYRLWTSLFLHGGLVHLVITIIFQMWIMRDLEKLMGAIRTTIIYIGSGVAGNLASCTFIPYQVEAGPSGAQFGIAACLLVEVLQSYQMYKHPRLALLKLCLPLLCFFILGLLPWFDNWAHIFGFIFGFLLAFALMPYITFGHFDRRRKIITILVCLGAAIGLFTLLVIIFYVAPLTDCNWCIYLNCIPFTADFCENMAVELKKNATYSSYI